MAEGVVKKPAADQQYRGPSYATVSVPFDIPDVVIWLYSTGLGQWKSGKIGATSSARCAGRSPQGLEPGSRRSTFTPSSADVASKCVCDAIPRRWVKLDRNVRRLMTVLEHRSAEMKCEDPLLVIANGLHRESPRIVHQWPWLAENAPAHLGRKFAMTFAPVSSSDGRGPAKGRAKSMPDYPLTKLR